MMNRFAELNRFIDVLFQLISDCGIRRTEFICIWLMRMFALLFVDSVNPKACCEVGGRTTMDVAACHSGYVNSCAYFQSALLSNASSFGGHL